MGISAIAGLIGAAATVYSASEQRKSAKEQAAQVAESARLAAAQAAESARGNALASQAAIERQRVTALAEQATRDAAVGTEAPVVQAGAAAPVEAARRRTVRATFSADEAAGGASGSIRV